MDQIAILYQAELPPVKDGVQKPMKPGGYSDSGADIACELSQNDIAIITPKKDPNINVDKDWVFPDTIQGIESALKKGANTFWLNTVLYENHSIESFFDRDIYFVGQEPKSVDIYDDKLHTNGLLKSNGIPIPRTKLISKSNFESASIQMDFPLVVKPIRGRGSQGVFLIHNQQELVTKLNEIFNSKKYGDTVYAEQYLSGQEITITVMPSGTYNIKNQTTHFEKPWCLPAVKRFNHINGVAPYNGIVAVMENSAVLSDHQLGSDAIQGMYSCCTQAAELISIKAPIRIDCRADAKGNYHVFDLNMKPNMTGPSRPQRKDQDSLTLLAARKIGWSYFDLLNNMLTQKWKAGS